MPITADLTMRDALHLIFSMLTRTDDDLHDLRLGVRGLAMGCAITRCTTSGGDAASHPLVQYPLRYEAIGGVEDDTGSSIESREDGFDHLPLFHASS